MSEENIEVIVLLDDYGNEVSFLVDDKFEYDSTSYLVLYEEGNDEDGFLFKVEEDDNEELVVVEVDDEDEFERVSNYYYGEE